MLYPGLLFVMFALQKNVSSSAVQLSSYGHPDWAHIQQKHIFMVWANPVLICGVKLIPYLIGIVYECIPIGYTYEQFEASHQCID